MLFKDKFKSEPRILVVKILMSLVIFGESQLKMMSL